jgi:protein KTI12
MPLVLLCGHPCSGKTKRAEEFIAYAKSISTEAAPITVQLINFETLNLDRNAFYKDVPSEKHGRAGIKAAVVCSLSYLLLVHCVV